MQVGQEYYASQSSSCMSTHDQIMAWPQVGFGLYPVIVKEFAAHEKANPVIFSFYRQVPFVR